LKSLKIRIFLYFILFLAGVSACSVRKFVPKGKYLVNNSKVILTDKSYPEITITNLKPYTQPKRNKRFLFWRVKLWNYYQNEKNHTKFSEWRNKKIGEQPVYFYSDNVVRNALKMEKYLGDIGFFHSKVDYSFNYLKKNKLVDIVYKVTPAKPYRYDTVRFVVEDTTLDPFLKKHIANSLLKKSNVYNAYTMDNERDRITQVLRNQGYYYFNRNYIQFLVDTNFRQHTASVKIDIMPREVTDVNFPGKVTYLPHKRYFLDSVNVIPDFDPLKSHNYLRIDHIIRFWKDTMTYHYNYFCRQPGRFALATFDNAINLKPGMPYSDEAVKKTYEPLFNYKVLRTTNISFEPAKTALEDTLGNVGYLNARIQMQTGKLNSISVEAVGTNSSGDLGMNGILSFINKNIFRRAEVFSLRFMGGFEAQHLARLPSGSTSTSARGNGLFNTFEAGVNASVTFPMTLFPFRKYRVSGMAQTLLGV